MILLVLLLTATQAGHAQRVQGEEKDGSCVCEVNSAIWAFPTAKYEGVTQLLQGCEVSLQKLQTQVVMTSKELPKMQVTLENVTARLQRFQYLNTHGLYNALHLRQLSDELQDLHQIISDTHRDRPSAETQKLSTELQNVQKDVEKMYTDNVFNLESVRERLRFLNNRAQTCRSIPDDFRSKGSCSHRIMTNISSPLITKLSPFGKSYTSGAWGRDTSAGSEERYWVQPLVNSHKFGNIIRYYPSFEDFMAGRNHRDESIAPSNTHTDAVQGPGTIMYDGVVYYQCYTTAELCSYNLQTKKNQRLKLPEAGVNNKFPYCYYNCRDWTDIDLAADSEGLWVMYATDSNYGNMVLSRVDREGFNVTHTWKTRLFKRSVTNAFMVCGVLYATRYVDQYKEEVFYAFDTSTGQEDNTLSLPLEKVSAGIANLHYNPTDMKLYMYNDGYLLSFQAFF
ncbi:olfactomedin-4-like isoform X1 [Colossoma macropomum]|uniref:olfactomedin-4-like isoform X1 n=1 Tax=Colossoma macropomum TaxID=42526 RepID=UPI0018655F0A|nr:olfactomedin-4-like isoform X1 [Colossoma macropomum]